MTDNTGWNGEKPPIKVAFIIDGKVVDVLHTDQRLAAIFLSDPVVIDVTQIYANANDEINMTGWDFDGDNFSYPATKSFTSTLPKTQAQEDEWLAQEEVLEAADEYENTQKNI